LHVGQVTRRGATHPDGSVPEGFHLGHDLRGEPREVPPDTDPAQFDAHTTEQPGRLLIHSAIGLISCQRRGVSSGPRQPPHPFGNASWPIPGISPPFRPSAWSRHRSRRPSLACGRTRPATSRTSTTTSSRWSLPATPRRPSTGYTGSSPKNATSSS